MKWRNNTFLGMMKPYVPPPTDESTFDDYIEDYIKPTYGLDLWIKGYKGFVNDALSSPAELGVTFNWGAFVPDDSSDGFVGPTFSDVTGAYGKCIDSSGTSDGLNQYACGMISSDKTHYWLYNSPNLRDFYITSTNPRNTVISLEWDGFYPTLASFFRTYLDVYPTGQRYYRWRASYEFYAAINSAVLYPDPSPGSDDNWDLRIGDKTTGGAAVENAWSKGSFPQTDGPNIVTTLPTGSDDGIFGIRWWANSVADINSGPYEGWVAGCTGQVISSGHAAAIFYWPNTWGYGQQDWTFHCIFRYRDSIIGELGSTLTPNDLQGLWYTRNTSPPNSLEQIFFYQGKVWVTSGSEQGFTYSFVDKTVYQMVIVKDHAASELRLYINGALVETLTGITTGRPAEGGNCEEWVGRIPTPLNPDLGDTETFPFWGEWQHMLHTQNLMTAADIAEMYNCFINAGPQ